MLNLNLDGERNWKSVAENVYEIPLHVSQMFFSYFLYKTRKMLTLRRFLTVMRERVKVKTRVVESAQTSILFLIFDIPWNPTYL